MEDKLPGIRDRRRKRVKSVHSVLVVAMVLSLLTSWSIFLPSAAHADIENVELPPHDDTYIVDTYPNTNHGVERSLYVGRYNGQQRETWLRFNLSNFPSGLGLKSATLKLYRKGVFGNPANILVQVYSTGTDWNDEVAGIGDETTLIWANKPEVLVNYTASGSTGDQFSSASYTRIPLNTSDLERLSQTSDRIVSLSLISPLQKDSNSYFTVYSKEQGAYSPSLELVFSSEGTEPDAQVAVLVDRSVPKQTYYQYFVQGVGKWFEWWKMDFEEIDVSATSITHSLLSKYKVIVVSQFKLAENGYLDSSELQAINQTVYEDGVGLVQADAYLQSYTEIWSDYKELFNVTVNGWVSTTSKMTLTIPVNNHFITEIYRSGTQMSNLFPNTADSKESNLVFANVTAGSDATSLAVMPYDGNNYSAIIARNHGTGRVLLSTFSTGRVSLGDGGFDGFGERANAKTTSGMNGLLWRSIVWAAKKPFAFVGMPPFLTFRVDDVAVGTYNPIYVDKLLQYGFFANLYIFTDDTIAGGGSYQKLLKNYYLNGSTHIAPHAFNQHSSLYWDESQNTEYPSSQLAKYFSWLDGNFTSWNITPSALIVPHEYEMGANCIPFLKEREWLFTSSIYGIPFSAGEMTNCWVWNTDWKRVCHLDYADSDNTIFNVDVDMPVGNPSYEFQDCLLNAEGNAAKAASQILSSLEHGLSDLFWAQAFTHEQRAITFSSTDWDKILTWVFGNITAQYPFIMKASLEYVARYALNMRQLSISSQSYVGNTLTLNFSGPSTLPTAFYLFTDQKISSYTGMLDYFRSYGDEGYLVWLPPFSNTHQASITFSDTETNLPRIKFTTANLTSTYSSDSQLIISAEPIWKHDKPIYLFEIDCANLGSPVEIVYSDGTSIDFVYKEADRTATFNKTLSQKDADITISWTNQQGANHSQMTFDHRDLDGDNVDSNITWEVYRDGRLVRYSEGAYTLLDGMYTLKTYYHGKIINETDLDTATWGNRSVTINLQMKSHQSVPNGFIAFNNSVTLMTILTETNENLTFAVDGFDPVMVIVDVPRNATYGYVQVNGENVTGWNYVPNSPSYIQMNATALGKWEFYFPVPPPVSVWQFTFNHTDLDGDAVDSRVTWELYNDSNRVSYVEGEYTLMNGIYTLKTYYHGLLISQTYLDTVSHGNSTVQIPLQMKAHHSASVGYIAFNNTVTSMTINAETDENLTFKAEGLSPMLIIADVPRNCTYIMRNGINQTGWTYVSEPIGSNYIYINASWLSTWQYFFPVIPAGRPAVFGKNSVGSKTDGLPAGYSAACRFQAPENGSATMISAYIRGRNTAGRAKLIIYSDVSGKPDRLLFESGEITLSSGWMWHNFSVSYQLQAGKYYWFTIFMSVDSQFVYDAGQTNQEAVAWGWSYPNVPTTFNGVYGPSYASNVDSIYVTYTADAQPPDTQSPSYSNAGHNTTLIGSPCLFYSKWQDDSGLSGYIFSTNNSGAWVNDPWVGTGGNPAWANVTKTLSSTGDLIIGYRWYCNDTNNNWRDTGIFTLTTILGDTRPPTYSNIQVSTTVASNPCQFSSYWQDQGGLSGFIFSTNNTGTWTNDTWIALGGASGWSNGTKTLSSTVGTVISFKWYCNDTDNNWNSTGIQTLTTTLLTPSAVFGKTTIGANLNALPVGYVVACRFLAPADGTATTVSAYIRGRYQSGLVKMAIYSDNAGKTGSLIFESSQIPLPTGWAWQNFSVNCQLQAGKYYWFTIFMSVESQFVYDAGQTGQQAVAWGWSYPSVPSAFNGKYGPSYANSVDSIYITYTPKT